MGIVLAQKAIVSSGQGLLLRFPGPFPAPTWSPISPRTAPKAAASASCRIFDRRDFELPAKNQENVTEYMAENTAALRRLDPKQLGEIGARRNPGENQIQSVPAGRV